MFTEYKRPTSSCKLLYSVSFYFGIHKEALQVTGGMWNGVW